MDDDISGNKYGMGTYFAKTANYTIDNRLSVPGKNCEKRIILCRVVVGEYTVGEPNLRYPPYNPNAIEQSRYDSVVDDKNNPEIFVVFKDFAAYPEYVLTIQI